MSKQKEVRNLDAKWGIAIGYWVTWRNILGPEKLELQTDWHLDSSFTLIISKWLISVNFIFLTHKGETNNLHHRVYVKVHCKICILSRLCHTAHVVNTIKSSFFIIIDSIIIITWSVNASVLIFIEEDTSAWLAGLVWRNAWILMKILKKKYFHDVPWYEWSVPSTKGSSCVLCKEFKDSNTTE